LFFIKIFITFVKDMGTDCNICSNNCYGINDYHGSCCSLEDRNYIIGPHPDTEDFIKNLSSKLGREIYEEDIFIGYEEGKKLFPYKTSWQNRDSYPAFRVDFFNPKLPCIFYNTKIKACSIYDIRPQTCREYECEYLSNNT
jgi:Fe-S-cluster containining protein